MNIELAFYGELIAGAQLDQVKTNLAAMFKASPEQIERMFSGKRVVIRNKLDLETAQKYVQAMEKRGARCQIERMGAPGEPYTETPAEDDSAATPVSEPASSAAPASQASVSQPTVLTTTTLKTTSDAPTPSEPPSKVAPATVTSTPGGASGESRPAPVNASGLPVAGEKVADILASSALELDPVGVRMQDEAVPLPELELEELRDVGLLPVGSDLSEKKQQVAPVIPDTSHLSIE